ncbi:MAG: ribosome small subunit-dependent GTPase A [Deltaproteobacteria bacterium]|nr:ribosome small subunit-dependent GTPase A [Deltaproteobacteria bacterium]
MKDWEVRFEKMRKRKIVPGKGEIFILNAKEWKKRIKQGYFAARVVEVQKRYVFVAEEPILNEIETREIWLGTVARTFLQAMRQERNFVVVGDRVLCKKGTRAEKKSDFPQCTIDFRAERESRISRLDPMVREREHVLAANVTQMVIVASFFAPKLKWGLIDRFLVLAEQQKIKICLILNKKDLLDAAEDPFKEECKEFIELYRSFGYPVFLTQANDQVEGELRNIFRNEISLVVGHSGVGKSSIINQMDPEIIQDVETQEVLLKGRHTTTYASFIKLGTGGFVIDTPGVRSFLIAELDPLMLTWCFVDLRPYAGKCKFRECKHLQEPNCAVLDALQRGELSEWRYKSYLAILTGASGREGRISFDDTEE